MLVDKSGQPLVSIVIPTYKAKDTIIPTVAALVNQISDLPYEVFVVDSSGDGTCELIRQRFPKVQTIQSPKRLYAGAARNLGAEQARGELLGFVDSDCVAEPNWISDMWRSHHQWECVAVAGSILNANPSYSTTISSYINEFSDFFPYGPVRYVDYLPSGNITYKAEIYRRYTGFDPAQPLYQDLVFNKKLSRAGEKLLFNPGIRIAHSHRVDLKKYLSHELQRGRAAADARRLGLIIGASWVKHPPLAFAVAPGLFMRKAAVFPWRFLRTYPTQSLRMLRALPCFYLALAVWHYGFLCDVVAKRSLNQEPKRAVDAEPTKV